MTPTAAVKLQERACEPDGAYVGNNSVGSADIPERGPSETSTADTSLKTAHGCSEYMD